LSRDADSTGPHRSPDDTASRAVIGEDAAVHSDESSADPLGRESDQTRLLCRKQTAAVSGVRRDRGDGTRPSARIIRGKTGLRSADSFR